MTNRKTTTCAAATVAKDRSAGEPLPSPTAAPPVADIEAAIATGRRADLRLPKPVPVAFVYLTGYATPDGTVHFRDDVYGLDAPKPEPPSSIDEILTSSITPRPPRRTF